MRRTGSFLSRRGWPKRRRISLLGALGAGLLALASMATFLAVQGPSAGASRAGPLSAEPPLAYWRALHPEKVAPLFDDLGTTEVYQELMRRTGIAVDFIHPPVGREAERLLLLVTSRNLPDIVAYDIRAYPGGSVKALADGLTVPHNAIIAEHAPNLARVFAQHPDWERAAKSDEGIIYGFPFIRDDSFNSVFWGPQFRKDWLDSLGLGIPETIDDWHSVLSAFKTKKKVPYPLSFVQKSEGDLYYAGCLPGAWGVNRGFFLDQKGKIGYGPAEPGWFGFVETMALWYSEGLVDPDFAVQDEKTLRAKIAAGHVGAFFGLAGVMGSLLQKFRTVDPAASLVGVPNPVLRRGTRSRFGQRDWPVAVPAEVFLTSKTRRIADAARFLDYGYSAEGQLLMNFGIEGTSYTWESGYPRYTDAILRNPQGLPMLQAMSAYTHAHYGGPYVQRKEFMEQFLQYPEQSDAVRRWAASSDFSSRLPPITLTEQESSRLQAIMTQVVEYVDRMTIACIMGELPLGRLSEVASKLRVLGIDEAISIQEAALERARRR